MLISMVQNSVPKNRFPKRPTVVRNIKNHISIFISNFVISPQFDLITCYFLGLLAMVAIWLFNNKQRQITFN